MKIIIAAVAGFCVYLAIEANTFGQKAPYTIRVDVVERTAKAINYPYRSGSTTIGFRGTDLQPGARGEAKVESKQGYTEIEVEFDDMIPPSRYGREYLTYVMWAVTPQGRSRNLGEVVLNGTKSKLDVTTELQSFGLIVTAEPYFAVNQPTDRVVLENYVRPDTRGKVEEITARYELREKSQFDFERMPNASKPTLIDTSLPLDLQQARHAVRIAQWAGADRYAPEIMSSTRELLNKAEEYFVRKAGSKAVTMASRSVVQNAEDARLIAMNRKQDEESLRLRSRRRR
ncbi:MAG TPA: DUF4398 domain-containing protein [Terriglobia bacterium]|nr:DUF4398 domain-containing protein [Terriglobia bacterium]